MSKLADKVQQDLIRAIDQDELVLPTLPKWPCRSARRRRTRMSASRP